jgi:archaellum biogenesis ATPase FlaH
MSNKSIYDKYSKYVDYTRLMPNTKLLLTDYDKYYSKFANHECIDWGVFYENFSQYWHKRDLDQEDIKYYRDTVLPVIQEQEDDADTILSLLELQTKDSIISNLENGIQTDKIVEILDSFKQTEQKLKGEQDEEVFSLDNVNLEVLDNTNGIEWFLPSLQQGLGCLMPGQFIVVSADSNTGKSAFCISQAVSVFKNSERPILYCTSEDTKEDLAARFLSNLFADKVKNGFESIVKHNKKVLDHFKKEYDPSLFIGMQINGPKDVYKIRTKIDTYKPCVVIIDMLDCLAKDAGHESLTAVYNEIRLLANSGYPIIGTTQSGNTTYMDKETKEYKHRKHLSEKDMAGSKYGKQGAAYCAIMIGKDDETSTLRYINTTKKKRGDHVSVVAEIVEKYSLYKELL